MRLSDIAHTCPRCQEIEVDGTGPDVEQCFQYSYPEVSKFAIGCSLFSWCLEQARTILQPTDRLILYICEGSEDVAYLNVEWKDEFGQTLSTGYPCDVTTLYVFADKGDPSARYVKSRPLKMSKTRPEDLQRCERHFERCLRHSECIEASGAVVNHMKPKRLLDVQHLSHKRLYTVSEGNHSPYVALSYCWGETQPEHVKTTRANVHDLHDAFNLPALPQTIQDAIKVCRALGFHYIWIDALCIIQDDDDDKASEIAKMGSIYHGASLTIAAASAKNSTDGFLQDRKVEEAYGKLFRMKYCHRQDEDITRGFIYLSALPISDKYQEPLDERGWTMQEDMLSLRLLRFGSKQTTWRCPKYPSGINIDGGSCPVRENEHLDFAVYDPSQKAAVQSRMIEAGALGSSSVFESWQNSIERYTFRKLTRASDRLSACAALAENAGSIMGLGTSHYLAGLWLPDLPAQLLWYRLEKPNLPAHLLGYWPAAANRARCSGPTWSWASLDGPVVFLRRSLLQYGLVVKAKAQYMDSDISHKFKQCQYAEVERGRLDIQGRVQRAHWDMLSIRRHVSSYERLLVTVIWDIVDIPPPETVWFLEIIGSYRTFGLVLVLTAQMSFQRVGYFESDAELEHTLLQNWFNEVEPQTISIY